MDDGCPGVIGTAAGICWRVSFDREPPRFAFELGELSRCLSDEVGRDVRCVLSLRLGVVFADCWEPAGLVIPTCKGFNEPSNELLRPFDSSASMKTNKMMVSIERRIAPNYPVVDHAMWNE